MSIDKREVRGLNLNIDINVNFALENMEVFKQGWRYLRNSFYDDNFNGVNWDAVRGAYTSLWLLGLGRWTKSRG